MDTQYQLQQEMELSFRRLNGEDLPALYEIELASFSHPWTREAYRKELEENPLALYWGCFSRQQMLAFAGLWQILDEGHITNIAVAPQYRRKGIGEWLLRRVARGATGPQRHCPDAGGTQPQPSSHRPIRKAGLS